MGILVEVCATCAADVFAAMRAGAQRVELNQSLAFGGLTPSYGDIELALTANTMLIAMLRPREGGFNYDDYEFAAMLRDAKAMIAIGVDGIAFGILTADGRIDENRCRAILDIVGDRESVFHRAFDMLDSDWAASLDTLCKLGFTRVLTSGHAKTALEGSGRIASMIKYIGNALEILPGGGVRANNMHEIILRTGATQLHTSAREQLFDNTASINHEISFTSSVIPAQGEYTRINEAAIAEFVELSSRL